MYYFAYGSNLWRPRLEERVGETQLVAVGKVAGSALRWHKRGGDGSGKCDAFTTPCHEAELFGAVFSMSVSQAAALDSFEGPGYRRGDVHIDTAQGPLVGFTYMALSAWIAPDNEPFDWYKAYVVQGAMACGLPPSYVQRITDQPARTDLDSERAARNWALLNVKNRQI